MTPQSLHGKRAQNTLYEKIMDLSGKAGSLLRRRALLSPGITAAGSNRLSRDNHLCMHSGFELIRAHHQAKAITSVLNNLQRFVVRPSALSCLLACALFTLQPDACAATQPPLASSSAASLPLGARFILGGTAISFRIFSSHATRIELYLYDTQQGSDEKQIISLTKEPGSEIWSAKVEVASVRANGISDTIYYGYRAWGPNWPFASSWIKGSEAGFIADVDGEGNRFNPNKLLFDPYALELSHDPRNPAQTDGSVYLSGPNDRIKDSGQAAPKGIVLPFNTTPAGNRPSRAFKDEIIYEVHLRGFTQKDSSVPAEERGTYAGAARKADYLKQLGVTAVEFLPIHESDNDQNEIPADRTGDNYWCYNTLGYFAPDRRFAKDKSPGGPTREFRTMVQAFHDQDIKVYLDVVYNHTGEGGVFGDRATRANVLSWRGLDNSAYYELTQDNRYTFDNTGVSGNFNCAHPIVRDLILDSLKYWSHNMGVDGFRFDLAPVLGNTLSRQRADGKGFLFDKMPAENALNRAAKELPVRPAAGGAGVDLIAEPWNGAGEGGQEQGNFPAGWAEWNDRFRDTFRKSQNNLRNGGITPADLAMRFAGSKDLYQDDGRKPWHSINFLVAHDGPTLRDLYSFNLTGRIAWNQDDNLSLQRQAARNGFLLPLLSAGVPMFTGGDEFYRTQKGHDNPYNQDTDWNYLNWANLTKHKKHHDFARHALAFRRAHPAFRPAEYFEGKDHNGNGLADITWYRDDGSPPDSAYWSAADRRFLAFRLDGSEQADPAPSIYVAYNGWLGPVTATLPEPGPNRAWHRVADTAAWMEADGNFRDPGAEVRLGERRYELKGRTLLVLIEK